MTVSTETSPLAQALGRVTSGIYILTTGQGDAQQGMLASWVMQAGFAPPAVTVAIQKDREVLKALEVEPQFVLNVLQTDNIEVMKRFTKHQPDAFEGLNYEAGPHGPVLKDTLASLTCNIKARWDGDGDHVILYAEVVSGDLLQTDQTPWVHTRKNGLSY